MRPFGCPIGSAPGKGGGAGRPSAGAPIACDEPPSGRSGEGGIIGILMEPEKWVSSQIGFGMTVRILSLFCRVRYQSANRTSSDIPADSAGEGALGRDKFHPRTPSFGRELGNAAKWRVDTSKAPGMARPCDVRRHPSKPARCTFMSDFGNARDLPTRTVSEDTAVLALEIRISGPDVEQHPPFKLRRNDVRIYQMYTDKVSLQVRGPGMKSASTSP